MSQDIVQQLDALSQRMSDAVHGELSLFVSAAAIGVALDAAEELTDVAQLQLIHHHTLYLLAEIEKLIAAKTS